MPSSPARTPVQEIGPEGQAAPADDNASFPTRRSPFKVAFGEMLVREAIPPSITWRTPEVSAIQANKAWKRGDRPEFIAASRVARTGAQYSAHAARRFARALLDAGLYEEALDVLHDPESRAEAPSFDRSRMLAHAWMRLGAPRRAAAELDRGLALAATPAEREELATLRRGLDVAAGDASGSWSETLALAAALTELRQSEQACRVLSTGLRRDSDAAEDHLDEVLERAFAAFRTARAGPAAGLLAAMGPLYQRHGEGEAWRSAMGVLRGVADGAPAPPFADDLISQKLGACLAGALAAGGYWRAAIGRYVPRPKAADLMTQVLCELARCVGEDFTATLDPAFQAPAGRRRVFDLFPFNGEFSMLELKLAAMSPWVDAFVVIEARQTFTGRPKPLYFPERASAFAALGDRIIHHAVDDFPSHLNTAWAREFFQRDQGALALRGRCSPDDIVILSDVDEIIRSDAVERLTGPLPLTGAELETFKYFFNFQQLSDRPTVKTAFARARLLERIGSSYLRLGACQYCKGGRLPQAGWHFTSIGPPEQLEDKFRSFSHVEYSHADRAHFEKLLRQARDGGLGPAFRVRPLDELPDFIRDRRAELAELLL